MWIDLGCLITVQRLSAACGIALSRGWQKRPEHARLSTAPAIRMQMHV